MKNTTVGKAYSELLHGESYSRAGNAESHLYIVEPFPEHSHSEENRNKIPRESDNPSNPLAGRKILYMSTQGPFSQVQKNRKRNKTHEVLLASPSYYIFSLFP
jgi:hypothetical protein